MTSDEYIKIHCCDKNDKVIRDHILIDEAVELVKITRKEERSCALDAFIKSCPCWSRFPQERKCNECIYAKEFVELLNKKETIHDKV